MEYRKLGNTKMLVSEIGLGCEYLEGKEYSVVKEVIDRALEAGINLLDVFMSEPNVRSNIGRALEGRREKVILQGHLRAVWKDGQYGRTLDTQETKVFFQDLLTRLNTDYIDIGMLHMVDNMADFEAIFHGGIYAYALELKKQGVIRAIGMSSHNGEIALKAVREGLIDVLLFSLNPAYDLLQGGEKGPTALNSETFGNLQIERMDPLRTALYQACESGEVGITVMKGLGAGSLLDKRKSPFGVAMTVPQCIHYALTRPAAASILVGMQTAREVEEAVAYEQLSPKERDYTPILASKPQFSLVGCCMYCNHCLPCVSHIDVAQVMKCLDLALAQGEVTPTVQAHYESMAHTAGTCTGCGACEKRCPFAVPVIKKMKQAVGLFGR